MIGKSSKSMTINTMLLLKYLRCATSPEEEMCISEWLANDIDGTHVGQYREAHLIFESFTLLSDTFK